MLSLLFIMASITVALSYIKPPSVGVTRNGCSDGDSYRRKTLADWEILGCQFCNYELFATDWTVRWSNSGWGVGEIFHTRRGRPCGPPCLLYDGYRIFPGGKAAGPWRWTPTYLEPRLKEE